MSLVIHPINRPFSPANTYPSSFWLLCFIPTFITKTLTIHYQDTHYSLSTSPHLSLAINYHLKINRFFLSYLTLLFSVQSTFCERRFVIHLKYFLQIYPPIIWWSQKSFLPRHFLPWTMAKKVISIRSRWGWLSYCRRDFRLSEEADWFIVQGKLSDGIRQKTSEYEWVETQEICRWNEVSRKEKVKQWYFYDTLMRLPGIRTEKSNFAYRIGCQVFKSIFSAKNETMRLFFKKTFSRKRKLWTF